MGALGNTNYSAGGLRSTFTVPQPFLAPFPQPLGSRWHPGLQALQKQDPHFSLSLTRAIKNAGIQVNFAGRCHRHALPSRTSRQQCLQAGAAPGPGLSDLTKPQEFRRSWAWSPHVLNTQLSHTFSKSYWVRRQLPIGMTGCRNDSALQQDGSKESGGGAGPGPISASSQLLVRAAQLFRL